MNLINLATAVSAQILVEFKKKSALLVDLTFFAVP